MAHVYQTDVGPVGQVDGNKVIECYERALQIVTLNRNKFEIYRGKGIHIHHDHYI